jgi:hypothetical protein
MRSSERPATSLGDKLQVPVALRRRNLWRCAWHRARTWRHNERCIRMTLAAPFGLASAKRKTARSASAVAIANAK